MSQERRVRLPLSPAENLAVGAFGGAVETCIQMPILTLKLCAQEGRPLPRSIPAWYRGVGIQAGTVAPITALQFMANGLLQSLVRGGESRELTDSESIATAAGAGAISALVYSPVDLITIQQQKLHLDPVRTARHIINEHGFATGLFRGFMSCAVREAVYTAGYLGLAPVITAHLTKSVEFFHDRPFAAGVTGASIAGTAAALLTHPVDTAKTILQADLGGVKFTTARDAASSMLKEGGGVGRLYNGAVPRTVRICGAFFVCMSFRDMAIEWKTREAEKARTL